MEIAKKIRRDFFQNLSNLASQKINFFFLAAALFLGIFYQWGIFDLIFFVLLIWIILSPLDSRYLASGAIICLILTPFFLIFKNEVLAERIAIFAYYFLVFTVIMAIYELKKEESDGHLPRAQK